MKRNHKVIMLPTEEATKLLRNTYKFTEQHGNPLSYEEIDNAQERGYEFNHLYIVSDEDIKEGDWFINVHPASNYLDIRAPEASGRFAMNSNSVFVNPKKVIATTDSSLKRECETAFECEHSCSGGYGGHEYGHPCIGIKLPKIPESFIKAYVEQGGIDEVQLEYYPRPEITMSGKPKCNGCRLSPDQCKCTESLKLRDDGTVIVHQAKMYSREEVIKLIIKYDQHVMKYVDPFGSEDVDIKKWIEENL